MEPSLDSPDLDGRSNPAAGSLLKKKTIRIKFKKRTDEGDGETKKKQSCGAEGDLPEEMSLLSVEEYVRNRKKGQLDSFLAGDHPCFSFYNPASVPVLTDEETDNLVRVVELIDATPPLEVSTQSVVEQFVEFLRRVVSVMIWDGRTGDHPYVPGYENNPVYYDGVSERYARVFMDPFEPTAPPQARALFKIISGFSTARRRAQFADPEAVAGVDWKEDTYHDTDRMAQQATHFVSDPLPIGITMRQRKMVWVFDRWLSFIDTTVTEAEARQ